METQKKTALITGASSGIGYETARHFAKLGWHVIATARRLDRLETLKDEFSNVETHLLDVREAPEKMEGVFDFSRVDVLVNNAGLALGTETIEKVSENDIREMFETNVFGLIKISQLVIPHMMKRKAGDIVNIGSVAGYQTYVGGSIYNATKFCIRALTEAWRKDFHGSGIRVIGIHPGMVETEFSEVRFRGDKTKAKNVYEGMRALTAADIAEAVCWSVTRPPHVNIESLLIMPTDQAAAGMVYRR